MLKIYFILVRKCMQDELTGDELNYCFIIVYLILSAQIRNENSELMKIKTKHRFYETGLLYYIYCMVYLTLHIVKIVFIKLCIVRMVYLIMYIVLGEWSTYAVK